VVLRSGSVGDPEGTVTMSEATPYAFRSMALMRPPPFASGTVAGASL